MKNIIPLLLLVILIGFVTPLPDDGLSVVTVEGDVTTGNTLPQWGTLCEDVDVQGDPYPYTPENTLYTLHKGERVRLHEQGGDGRSWVMIAPANWIRGNAVCGW